MSRLSSRTDRWLTAVADGCTRCWHTSHATGTAAAAAAAADDDDWTQTCSLAPVADVDADVIADGTVSLATDDAAAAAAAVPPRRHRQHQICRRRQRNNAVGIQRQQQCCLRV